MPKSSTIEINPEVLNWARVSAGWKIEEVARKLEIDPKLILKWENTPTQLPIKILREFSKYYKRSFEVFLLPKPPKEAPLPKDFRLIANTESLSKESLLAIRKSRRLQEIASSLLSNYTKNLNPKVIGAGLNDSPEIIASKERANFDVPLNIQTKWKNGYTAFRFWRNAIGERNIFVFQISMSSEIRGFSLGDEKPSVIVVNSSDTINARIFTLFHEYGHLILKTPGICDPTKDPMKLYISYKIEKWCNQFAASFLMPKEDVLKLQTDTQEISDRYIAAISNKLKVSREALLLRFLTLNLIGREQFDAIWKKIKSEPKKPKSNKVILIDLVKQSVSERGIPFVSLVLESKNKNFITNNQALDYLSVKTKHLEKIQNYL